MTCQNRARRGTPAKITPFQDRPAEYRWIGRFRSTFEAFIQLSSFMSRSSLHRVTPTVTLTGDGERQNENAENDT